jgi:hypothetical protein
LSKWYDITLIDDTGSELSLIATEDTTPGAVDDFALPAIGQNYRFVNLRDQSQTFIYNVGITLRLRANPSSEVEGAKYLWEFWDGTAQTTTVPYVDKLISEGGTLNYTVTVITEEGQTNSSTGAVIVNQPPLVTNVNLSENNKETPFTTTISVEAYDPDNIYFPVTYQWIRNGEVLEGESNNSLTVELEEPGTETITCQIRDEFDGLTEVPIYITGRVPLAPTTSAIGVNPSGTLYLGNGRTATLSVGAYDNTGDILSYAWDTGSAVPRYDVRLGIGQDVTLNGLFGPSNLSGFTEGNNSTADILTIYDADYVATLAGYHDGTEWVSLSSATPIGTVEFDLDSTILVERQSGKKVALRIVQQGTQIIPSATKLFDGTYGNANSIVLDLSLPFYQEEDAVQYPNGLFYNVSVTVTDSSGLTGSRPTTLNLKYLQAPEIRALYVNGQRNPLSSNSVYGTGISYFVNAYTNTVREAVTYTWTIVQKAASISNQTSQNFTITNPFQDYFQSGPISSIALRDLGLTTGSYALKGSLTGTDADSDLVTVDGTDYWYDAVLGYWRSGVSTDDEGDTPIEMLGEIEITLRGARVFQFEPTLVQRLVGQTVLAAANLSAVAISATVTGSSPASSLAWR